MSAASNVVPLKPDPKPEPKGARVEPERTKNVLADEVGRVALATLLRKYNIGQDDDYIAGARLVREVDKDGKRTGKAWTIRDASPRGDVIVIDGCVLGIAHAYSVILAALDAKGMRQPELDKHTMLSEEYQKKQLAKAAREAKKAAREHETVTASATLGDRYKFIAAAGAYYDVIGKCLLKKDTVHMLALPYCPPDMPPAKVLMRLVENTYDRLAYAPTQPREFKGKGQRCLNIYEASTLQASHKGRGKCSDAAPWLLHVRKFFGADVKARRHFLDWVAFKVQHKDVKVRHGVILGSKQGHGKGTLSKPLKPIFGATNFVEPDNNEILKGTLAFLENKLLVIVNELKAADNKNVADNMKPVISEDSIRVKRLWMDPFEIENPASVLAFTNHYNAIFLEESDRRWFLFDSKSPKESDDYFKRLHSWIDGDGAAHVLAYLLARDVSGFNPNAAPPETTTKRHAIESSRGETRQTLIERWHDKAAPFDREVWRLLDLVKLLQQDLPKATQTMVKAFLRDNGAEPFNEHEATDYTQKGQKKRARLWLLRNAPQWRKASPAALGAEMWTDGML